MPDRRINSPSIRRVDNERSTGCEFQQAFIRYAVMDSLTPTPEASSSTGVDDLCFVDIGKCRSLSQNRLPTQIIFGFPCVLVSYPARECSEHRANSWLIS